MSGSRRRAVDKARRAVRCLALEVPPDVWRDFHAEIEEAFDALSQPTDALVEALEKVEWAGDWNPDAEEWCCPECGQSQGVGHTDRCIVGTALAAARGEEVET